MTHMNDGRKKKISSIHGRFQPFHNGHLDYFRWAKSKSDLVYVGITQIYNYHEGSFPGADHRGKVENNPLSYFERMKIIEDSIIGDGFALGDFRIIPFPIEDPYRLESFFPKSGICYTTLHSEWNKHKVEILRLHGFDVEVISGDENENGWVSGTNLRELIRSNNSSWKQYVPKGSIPYLSTLLEIF